MRWKIIVNHSLLIIKPYQMAGTEPLVPEAIDTIPCIQESQLGTQ
jgi:hypothetical protein